MGPTSSLDGSGQQEGCFVEANMFGPLDWALEMHQAESAIPAVTVASKL